MSHLKKQQHAILFMDLSKPCPVLPQLKGRDTMYHIQIQSRLHNMNPLLINLIKGIKGWTGFSWWFG